ncbi:hypothetical protein MHY1_01270 [Methylovirgula sp. HY1]|nr:hypothetical protein MHY1_01270 [Methylovirgula sp. HY1]
MTQLLTAGSRKMRPPKMLFISTPVLPNFLFPQPNMMMRRLLTFFVSAIFLCGGANLGRAQGVIKSKHGDWQLRCETPPGALHQQCALLQSVTAEDRPNVSLVVIILKTADGKSRLLRVIAPLGVLLPSGLGLKIDNADVGRAGFVRCLPSGCIAEVVMEPKLIQSLKNGHKATFIIFQTPEEGIGIPLNLTGFAEGYDALP